MVPIFFKKTATATLTFLSVFFLINISPASATTIPRDGLVGEWLLNGNALDTSGNGNHGVASNVTYSSGGASFNGSTSFVEMPSKVLTSNNFSFSLWVYNLNDNQSQDTTILSNQNDAGTYGVIFARTNPTGNTYNVFYGNGAGSWIGYDSPLQITLEANKWTHVVFTKNGVDTILYKNGILDKQFSQSSGDVNFTNSMNMTIGKYPNQNIRYFNGVLQTIRFYNRTLTPSEIQSLYQEGSGPSCSDGIKNQDETSVDFGGVCGTIPRNGLVAEYLLNGNANDTSGNGNNGLASNVSWENTNFRGQEQSASFNGSSSYFSKDSNLGIIGGSGTISGWFNISQAPTNGQAYQLITQRDSGSATALTILYQNNVWFPGYGLFFDRNRDYIVSNNSNYSIDLGTNKYFYLTLTYDGSTITGYVNGERVISGNGAGNGNFVGGSSSIRIGRGGQDLFWGDNWFNGVAQGVRVYNRALTPSEIQSLYQEGSGPSCSDGIKNQDETSVDFGGVCGTIPRNGLVAEYLLNGNANDTSGNGNHGSLVEGEITTDQFGNSSSAYAFNSSASRMYTNVSISQSSDYSISMDIRAGDYGNQTIFYGGPNITDGSALYDFVDYYGGNIRLYRNSGVYYPFIADNTWHRFTFTFGSSGFGKIYKDGVLVASGDIGISTQNLKPIFFGRTTGVIRSISGDNVRLYNRVLSDGEILSLYHEGTPTFNTSLTFPTTGYTGTQLSAFAGSISTITQVNNDIISNPANGDQNIVKDMADPVSLSTGEFTYNNTFMQIPGVANPYEFSLTYRNQLPYDGPVGNKFDHNYNMFLVESTGAVNFFNGKLGIFNFAQTGATYEYNKGLKSRLSKDATSGLYVLTFDNGTKYLFGENLKVSKMMDKQGNTLSFGYNADKQLTTVTDTLGRDVTYTYNSDTRLQKATDFNGRSVELSYFVSGDTGGGANDLKSVTIKSGTESKTISYTYDTSHNILTLTDSKGQIYVNNVYDVNNRVTSQKYGTGMVNYTYTLTGSTTPSVFQNDVINANGVHTKYTYDTSGNTTKREIYDNIGSGSTVYSYLYDTNARLQKSILPKGNGTAYKYDARGNIIEERQKTNAKAVDNATDLVTTYEYDGVFDVPVKVTLPNGLVKTFALDNSGNVLSQTASGLVNPDGTTYSSTLGYEYNTIGQLTRKTDVEGNTTSYTYASGQLVNLTHGTGASTIQETFNYDAYGNLVSSTDGEGHTKLLTYTPFNLAANTKTAEGIETRFTYDANNNKTREEKYTLADGVISATDYTYDDLDHVASKTEKIDGTHSKTTAMTYDGNGNILTAQEGTGALVRHTYDEMNRVKTKRVIVNPALATSDLVTTNTYDRNGNTTRVTDPMNRSTSFAYDLFDRVTRKTDALGNYTTYTYDRAGNILEAKSFDKLNVLLQRTTSEYDLLGHVIRSTVYDLTNIVPTNITTTTKYDRNGNIVEKTDPKGTKTLYTYDAFGRPTETLDALGNRTILSYDKRSLVVTKSITSSGSSYALTTTLGYDNDGRLILETNTEGKTKKYTYNAQNQVIKTEDENGHITEMSYNAIGQILSEKKSLTESGVVDVVTSYAYDTTGNLTSLTDPNGNTTSYQYDLLNRKIKEVLPDGKTTVFVYDKNSNLTKVTDPNGTSTTNTYDVLNRIVKRTITPASKQTVKGTTLESFAYDSLGRLKSTSSTGNLVGSGQLSVNSIVFAYDSQNRLMSETENGVSVSYGYDINGNRTSIESGTGYLTKYSYDLLNRLTGVNYNSGNIASYSYSGTLLERMNLGNGVTTTYTYDSLLRLQSLSHDNISLNIASRNYTYDPASNLVSDGQKSYAYDSIDRLTGAFALSGVTTPVSSASFEYDLTGNRGISTVDGIVKSYSGNILNQYLTTTLDGTDTTYVYDANGNLTNNGIFTFAYDYKNRLVWVKKVADNSLVAQYVYDILGRRVQKLTPSTRTDYVYAGENAILETNTNLAKNTIQTTNRVYGNDTDDLLAYETDDTTLASSETPEYVFCLARVLPYTADFEHYGWTSMTSRCNTLGNSYNTTERKLFFVQKDHLGSTIALTDSTGNVVQSYAYDVYGTPYIATGTGFTALRDFVGNLHGNDRFYTGREYEVSTGLYYYRARFYSPELGRFISRDPIGMADQVNLYAYVGNSPMMGVDPDGRMVKAAIPEAADFIGIKDAAEGLGNVAAFWTGYATDDTALMAISEAGMRDSLGRLMDPVGFAMSRVNKVKKLGSGVMGFFGKKAKKVEEKTWWSKEEIAEEYRIGRENGTLKSNIGGGSAEGKTTGSYTVTFESGMQYHGKGPDKRARDSAKRESKVNSDEAVKIEWEKAANDKEAFIEEAKKIRDSGGIGSPNLYNRRNSPGNKYLR